MEFVMGNGETVTLEGPTATSSTSSSGSSPNGVKTRPTVISQGPSESFLSLTYLDADGVPIAAQGPNGRIGDLPPLARYPFLGTQV